MLLHEFENARIPNHTVLHGFEQARPVLAFGKRRQHIRIDQHTRRLMEGPEQVLATREVDSGLATDRRVHLRDQGRRRLHHRNSAHENRCEESTDIADYASTQGDNDGLPVRAMLDQTVGELFQIREAFGTLAIRHFEETHLA